VHSTIISAVKLFQFVTAWMSRIILLVSYIVLTVHASTVHKTDDVKDGFYKELEHVFDKLPNYHMKILLEVSIPK
jgi:hypothetical protein